MANSQNFISSVALASQAGNCSFSQLCKIFIHFHSIGMCRMRQFLAVLRSSFHFFLSYTPFFHTFPPLPPGVNPIAVDKYIYLTSLPSSLTSSCHLFLGLPLSLLVSKFTYNTLPEILFSSNLCTCPNQRNLFNLIVSVIVGFLNIA